MLYFVIDVQREIHDDGAWFGGVELEVHLPCVKCVQANVLL